MGTIYVNQISFYANNKRSYTEWNWLVVVLGQRFSNYGAQGTRKGFSWCAYILGFLGVFLVSWCVRTLGIKSSFFRIYSECCKELHVAFYLNCHRSRQLPQVRLGLGQVTSALFISSYTHARFEKHWTMISIWKFIKGLWPNLLLFDNYFSCSL